MDTIKIYAEYIPQFHAYCVSDEKIQEVISQGKIPEIYLKNEYITALGGNSVNSPLVGFLMGRETGYYSIDYNYAKCIIKSGVRLKLLTYEYTPQQMSGLKGLILPGGAFSSPDRFYCDNKKEYVPNDRYVAYRLAISRAEAEGLPMLGICAGAQMIACFYDGCLYRNVSEYTDIIHKSKESRAHNVIILPGNPLSRIFVKKRIMTNSRHREALNPNVPFELTLYAVAEDGIPEAWGSEKEKILCIQWHPEDLAVEGNKAMQEIYNWLAKKAAKE